nr:hypothetical protein [Tanacetum cinerariifolium]
MAAVAQNTNNTTIRSILLAEKLTAHWTALDPEAADSDTIDKYYESVNLEQEVACLMLSSYEMLNKLGVSLILNSLNKDYDLAQNYNMHNIRKTLVELHAYALKTKIPSLPRRYNPTKDSICHHCKEVGHYRRNFSSYHAELKKRKNASKASNSGSGLLGLSPDTRDRLDYI